MPTIKLNTKINAPVQTCFDLSRSIDLHVNSMKHTGETAIAGVASGLINLDETVTWKARHFGVMFTMQIKITQMQAPDFFVDEMLGGPFKKLKHRHTFKSIGNFTIMSDEFEFKSPFGIIGSLVDKLFLENYMTVVLKLRNNTIKQFAESKTQ